MIWTAGTFNKNNGFFIGLFRKSTSEPLTADITRKSDSHSRLGYFAGFCAQVLYSLWQYSNAEVILNFSTPRTILTYQ